MSDECDSRRVRLLAEACNDALVEHYTRAPTGRMAVYEALNGFAVSLAAVIVGAGTEPAAIAFFNEALAGQIAAYERGGRTN